MQTYLILVPFSALQYLFLNEVAHEMSNNKVENGRIGFRQANVPNQSLSQVTDRHECVENVVGQFVIELLLDVVSERSQHVDPVVDGHYFVEHARVEVVFHVRHLGVNFVENNIGIVVEHLVVEPVKQMVDQLE